MTGCRSRARHGFTLIEMTAALALLLVLGGALYRLLLASQRAAQAQTELIGLQSAERNGALLVPAELRELAAGPGWSDIASVTDTSIGYRAMRGLGFVCALSATEVRIRDGAGRRFGYRLPQAARDSLLVFYDDDAASDADDRWIPFRVQGVAAGNCPDGTPGLALAIATPNAVADGVAAAAGFAPGAPVRVYEQMYLGLYLSSGQRWLGARSVSAGETIQPVLGPLAPRGFRLEGFDAAGAPTTDPLRIRSMQVTLHGVTARAVHAGGGQGPVQIAEDSLVARVRLRNAS